MEGIERLTRWLRRLRIMAAAVLAVVALSGLAVVGRDVRVMVVALLVTAAAGVAYGIARRHLPRRILLEVDLDQTPVEQHDVPLLGAVGAPPVLRDVVETLERAATDDRVEAVLVRLGTGQVGLARAQELRDALATVRRSGTRTVAVAETFGESRNGTADYHVASVCDEVVLHRAGEMQVVGFTASTPLLRGAFDRLSVEPRFDHRREYKSAMYLFTEEELPEPARAATQAILDATLDRVVADVAASRGLSQEAVRAAVDRGPLLPGEAVDAGLVDRLAYRDEVRDGLTGEFDATPVEFDAYRRRSRRRERGPVVAVVYATGPVTRGRSRPDLRTRTTTMGSDDVVQALDQVTEDKRVRAVVLRVDSPGGSAVASDAIWRAVARTREHGTPVVASMGDVAASGGYFVACGADRIVAQPTTLTGSIGVVAGKLVTAAAWRRFGIGWGQVTAGAHAAIWSQHTDFGPSEWDRFQAYLDDVYVLFKERVATGRGLTEAEVEEVAKGRVWTGSDAHRVGLVDELGGLGRAVGVAKELAGIDGPTRLRVVSGGPRSPLERLSSQVRALRTTAADVEALAAPLAATAQAAVPPGAVWWDGTLD